MAAILQAESTLTDRYQTTVPEPIRQALRLGKRDKIHYELKDGNVVISRAEAVAEADPVMGQFLNFLAKDIAAHPERVKAVDASFVERLRARVDGVEVDLDAALSPEDE
jgi:antitoxin PrlF